MNATTNHDTQDTIEDLRSLGEADSLDDLRGLTDDTPLTIAESLDDTVSLDNVAPASSGDSDSNQPEQSMASAPVTEIKELISSTPVTESASIAEVKEIVSPTPVASSVAPHETTTPEATITPTPVANLAADVSSPTLEPSNDDGYHPSFALKVFTIFRHGIIVFFDIVLTALAIVIEKIADIDWLGMLNAMWSILGQVDEQIQNRLPRNFRLALYGILLIVLLGLPISVGAFSLFSGDKSSAQDNSSQIMAISQGSIATDNDILAPLFTPTVQFWATDIARWTANSTISPDMFAVVMQLESCGNPTVEGGLFGIADANSTFNDPEADAPLALTRLENALTLSNNDYAMALAIYADGDKVLQNDFTTWSFHGRDMYILGRNFYYQAQQGMPTSPDLTSWMQNTGAVLCTQAHTTLNN